MKKYASILLAFSLTCNSFAGIQTKKCSAHLGATSACLFMLSIVISAGAGLGIQFSSTFSCATPEYPQRFTKNETIACLQFDCDSQMSRKECRRADRKLCDGTACAAANLTDLHNVSDWQPMSFQAIQPGYDNSYYVLFFSLSTLVSSFAGCSMSAILYNCDNANCLSMLPKPAPRQSVLDLAVAESIAESQSIDGDDNT